MQIEKRKFEKKGSGFSFNIKEITAKISLPGSGKVTMNMKKKENFFSELGMLLSSGIDIKTSMEIVVENQVKENEKALFETIYSSILKGISLSESMKESGVFSDYDFYCIRIGEETGKVETTLEGLSSYYAQKVKQNRQLVNAFSYPVLVLCTALAAVFFMMNYMVPMFSDIFLRANKELPKITQIIVGMSKGFSTYFIYVVLLISSVIIYLYLNKQKTWYRKHSSRLLLKMPLFGDLMKKIYLQKMFQSMSLLIGSRVTMVRALRLVKEMIGFYPLELAVMQIEEDMMSGKALHESMHQFPLFDKRVTSLIKVGEETNRLDDIFTRLYKQYTDEIEHQLSLLSSMLEPILIIFIGALVAVILIAMYLPMFQMGTTIY